MCEIFGALSGEKPELNDYLEKFYSNSPEHPNGWGLGLMGNGNVSIEKEPVQATKSEYLKNRLSVPVKAKVAMAHIRYATIGNVRYANCHPFTMRDKSGRQWVQNHNGTIFDFAPLNKYAKLQQGDCDSERILMYVIDEINRAELAGQLCAKDRFDVINQIICEMSFENKLNYMLYDGEIFYIHTNYEGSLHILQRDDCTLFSTRPLSNENWVPLPMNTLLGFKGEKMIFRGTDHGNTYVENPENMKLIYRFFSEL